MILSSFADFLAGDTARQIYWALAIGGSVIFVIMAVTAFVGMDGISADPLDGELDPLPHADTGFESFHLISFRSLMAFCTVFGWGGVLWGGSVGGFLGALGAGLLMMFLTALLFWLLLRLQHSGNHTAEDFLNRTATVYISIPAGRAAGGKVTVSTGDTTHELAAVADEALETGRSVTVAEKIAGNRYLVKPL